MTDPSAWHWQSDITEFSRLDEGKTGANTSDGHDRTARHERCSASMSLAVKPGNLYSTPGWAGCQKDLKKCFKLLQELLSKILFIQRT